MCFDQRCSGSGTEPAGIWVARAILLELTADGRTSSWPFWHALIAAQA